MLGASIPQLAVAAPESKPASSQKVLPPHVAGTVIVGFRHAATVADRASLRAAAGVRSSSPLSPLAPDAEVWRLGQAGSVPAAIASLVRNPLIRYAEPDYLVETASVSNDPYYTNGNLWGMYGDGTSPSNAYGSQAGEAWAAGATGSSSVYVGVIDEGIQFAHPDLDANVWTNPFETVDGVDNDGNGYKDDVHGWDFVSNDSSVYDGTSDDHATHVAGTIGGEGGNGIGVAGVNWSVTMISGKFLGSSGGSTSGAILAVDYMTDLKTRHGLNIVATSNSWGGGGYSQGLLDAINRGGDAGILFIAAAGNSGTNNDSSASYPSNYECTKGGTRGWDCVVAVAAIDSAGALASFSQYGAATVDLGAPGVAVMSTVPDGSYASYSGTSMATPHVSGAAALCASIDPTLGASSIKQNLLASTTATSSLSGKTVTGGRLDVGTLASRCAPATVAVSGSPSGLVATAGGPRDVSLVWSDGVSDESAYEVQRAPSSSGTCGTFATISSIAPGSTSYSVGGLTASTSYCFRVRGVNGFGGGSQSAWSNTASATTEAPPAPYVCSSSAIAWVDPTGGTSYALTDDSAAYATIPFGFRYYGTTFTDMAVSSNGFIRLGGGAASQYANDRIPTAADPNAFIAAFWDDLNPGAGGSVRTKVVGSSPNRTFVVTWSGVPHFSVAGSALSFQIVLEESTGAIVLQYLDATAGSATYDRGASATVGLEDEFGLAGTQISYNSATVSDGSAYRCANDAPAPIAPTISATTFSDGTTGVAYSASQSASGGVGPYVWSIASGSLPPGLTLTSSTGAIAGTPASTSVGTWSFTVKVLGSDGGSSTRTASIRVDAPLAISTSSLATATAGAPYSLAMATTGGRAPLTWTISGTRPAGLTFSAGSFSGTPTESGLFPLTITATDAAGRVATRALTLTVAFGKLAPSNASKTATYGATLTWSGDTRASGASAYRYCISTSKTCTPSTTVSGTSVAVGGLRANTTYYWQVQYWNGSAWVNANGTTFWRFTTPR